jgi:trimethylamine:corrinoid methyltransferase-like protein
VRTTWEKNGSLDTHARAMQRVREILSRPSHTIFDPETETHLRAQFTNLVAGELAVPDGL